MSYWIVSLLRDPQVGSISHVYFLTFNYSLFFKYLASLVLLYGTLEFLPTSVPNFFLPYSNLFVHFPGSALT